MKTLQLFVFALGITAILYWTASCGGPSTEHVDLDSSSSMSGIGNQ